MRKVLWPSFQGNVFFNTQDVNSQFPIPIQVVFEISYVEIIATSPIEENISNDRPAAIYVWQFYVMAMVGYSIHWYLNELRGKQSRYSVVVNATVDSPSPFYIRSEPRQMFLYSMNTSVSTNVVRTWLPQNIHSKQVYHKYHITFHNGVIVLFLGIMLV